MLKVPVVAPTVATAGVSARGRSPVAPGGRRPGGSPGAGPTFGVMRLAPGWRAGRPGHEPPSSPLVLGAVPCVYGAEQLQERLGRRTWPRPASRFGCLGLRGRPTLGERSASGFASSGRRRHARTPSPVAGRSCPGRSRSARPSSVATSIEHASRSSRSVPLTTCVVVPLQDGSAPGRFDHRLGPEHREAARLDRNRQGRLGGRLEDRLDDSSPRSARCVFSGSARAVGSSG